MEEEVNLKKFDILSMGTNFRAYLVGSSGCGKSVLLDSLLFTFRKTFDIVIGISPTESSLNLLRKYIPETFIYRTCDVDEINNIIAKLLGKAEELLEEGKSRRILVVFDDCGASKNFLRNNEMMKQLHMRGRHLNICVINIMQYCMDIDPSIRDQITHAFGFQQDKVKSITKLNENLFGVVDDPKYFNQLYKGYTTKFGCLVLVPDQSSSHWKDKLRWYRAEFVEGRSAIICNRNMWKLHYMLYRKKKACKNKSCGIPALKTKKDQTKKSNNGKLNEVHETPKVPNKRKRGEPFILKIGRLNEDGTCYMPQAIVAK